VAAYWVPARLSALGEAIELAYQIHLARASSASNCPPNGYVTQSARGVHQAQHAGTGAAGAVLISLARAEACLKVLLSRPSPPQMPMAACWKASPTKTPATGGGAPRCVQRLDASQPIELCLSPTDNNNTPSETWTNLITP
jgi:glucan biosynthesis protein